MDELKLSDLNDFLAETGGLASAILDTIQFESCSSHNIHRDQQLNQAKRQSASESRCQDEPLVASKIIRSQAYYRPSSLNYLTHITLFFYDLKKLSQRKNTFPNVTSLKVVGHEDYRIGIPDDCARYIRFPKIKSLTLIQVEFYNKLNCRFIWFLQEMLRQYHGIEAVAIEVSELNELCRAMDDLMDVFLDELRRPLKQLSIEFLISKAYTRLVSDDDFYWTLDRNNCSECVLSADQKHNFCTKEKVVALKIEGNRMVATNFLTKYGHKYFIPLTRCFPKVQHVTLFTKKFPAEDDLPVFVDFAKSMDLMAPEKNRSVQFKVYDNHVNYVRKLVTLGPNKRVDQLFHRIWTSFPIAKYEQSTGKSARLSRYWNENEQDLSVAYEIEGVPVATPM